MPLSAGTRLGPYEIVALRGAGGMGEVYRARDTRLDRAVAIKILPSADPDLKARFEREAKAIAALAHPHICTLFDVANQDGTDYLVMEYLEGETLADKLQRGSLKCQDCRRCRDCRGALPAIARIAEPRFAGRGTSWAGSTIATIARRRNRPSTLESAHVGAMLRTAIPERFSLSSFAVKVRFLEQTCGVPNGTIGPDATRARTDSE